jgi:hypothetical protein
MLDFVPPQWPGRGLLRFGRQAGRDKSGGQKTHLWVLTEPATKLKSQAAPYRFLTTWPDNGLGKDGAGRRPWEKELDPLPTLWWPICAQR